MARQTPGLLWIPHIGDPDFLPKTLQHKNTHTHFFTSSSRPPTIHQDKDHSRQCQTNLLQIHSSPPSKRPKRQRPMQSLESPLLLTLATSEKLQMTRSARYPLLPPSLLHPIVQVLWTRTDPGDNHIGLSCLRCALPQNYQGIPVTNLVLAHRHKTRSKNENPQRRPIHRQRLPRPQSWSVPCPPILARH